MQVMQPFALLVSELHRVKIILLSNDLVRGTEKRQGCKSLENLRYWKTTAKSTFLLISFSLHYQHVRPLSTSTVATLSVTAEVYSTAESVVLPTLKGWAKLVNFVPGVVYHLCLNLPAAFTKPGDHFFLAHPCERATYVCGAEEEEEGMAFSRS